MKWFATVSIIITGMVLILHACQQRETLSDLHIPVSSYLGDAQRNYYGNLAPDKLDTIWRLYLGEGISPAYGNPKKVWKGAGWTGQPLIVIKNDTTYLIQGAFDYHLKKIRAADGKLIWQYRFDDILKGTGTIWQNRGTRNPEDRYIIIQGSRRGVDNTIDSRYCPSLRGISLLSGTERWRMNVRRTASYSRDVDGSALTWGDTAYLALENGIFTVFSPDPDKQQIRDNMMQPAIYREISYFIAEDTLIHGGNIESESSPCILNGRIYTTTGSGRVYGYNIQKGEVDWIFEIGADLNGSPVVTSDSCLLIPVEKQYISGPGGVFKLNPSLPPEESVVWYYPVGDSSWFHWEGGIVGSVAINDRYAGNDQTKLAAFIGVDGRLVVVDHMNIAKDQFTRGPQGNQHYPLPKVIYREKTGGTISTPVMTENRLIAPLDDGLILYGYNQENMFTKLDSIPGIQIDATPVVWNGRLYVASLDGYLYCFGNRRE